MTRNNLANHLPWLLSNVQLSRPTGPPLPAVHKFAFDNAPPSITTTASIPSQQLAPQPHARDAPPRPSASSSSTTLGANILDIDLSLDEDETLFLGEEEEEIARTVARSAEMKRLTTKGTKKPSLVSKQEQLPTPPTTVVGKLQQAYSASLSQKNSAVKASTPTAKPSRSRTPSRITGLARPAPRDPTPEIPEDVDEELHDLTGAGNVDPDATTSTAYTFGSPVMLWTEEHAWRAQPAGPGAATPSRGKKRKSSEMAKPSPKPKSRSKPSQGIKEEDDDFPDICDLVDDDLMTPAMVKRRNAGSSSPWKSPSKPQMSAPDMTVLTQRTVTQTVSTTETTIHRTASQDRTPYRNSSRGASTAESPLGKGKGVMPPPLQPADRSGALSPVHSHSKQRSPSPVIGDESFMSEGGGGAFEPQRPSSGPFRRFKRSDVIVDSDDELERFETPPTRDVSDLSFVTAATETRSGSERKRISPGPSAEASKKLAFETPAKWRALSTQRTVSEPSSPPKNGHSADRMEIDDEEQGPQKVEPARERHSSESDGETLVMDLFKLQPHILDILKRSNMEKFGKNSMDYIRCLRESWPNERKTQIKQEKEKLRQQKQALVDVEAAYNAFKQTNVKREELLDQLSRLYDADADDDVEEVEDRVDAASAEIKEREAMLKQKLVAAGVTEEMLNNLPGPSPQHPEPSLDSMVSIPSSVRPPRSVSRESTFIPGCDSQNNQFLSATPRPPSRVVSFEQPRFGKGPSVSPFPQEGARAPPPVESSNFARRFSRAVQDDQDVEDFLDDDDDDMWAQPDVFQQRSHVPSAARASAVVRSRSPTKSKTRHQENFSDYGDGDGDDDLAAMVAMAEEVEVFEQRQPFMESVSNRRARPILSEASGNTISSARVKALVAKPAKAVPKLRIPPEMMQHPWSKDVLRAFKDRFRLEGFRQNQLEAINATLDGQDAFVLMPTGGGKSLCYQLPAVINSGKTRGVTIVVTPLLSLMQDQVDHLTSRGIIAKAFNGDMDRSEKQDILQSFKLKNPEHHVQLLYVTPEMINKSTNFLNGLQTLYRNKKFARLVIDEAHCVSQWGHDFRPDYKELGQVRQQFPGVPIIALTATATENVIVDVKHNLSMENCKIFSQSFNRPNLYYEVRQKEKQPIDRIADLINERYQGKTGIVYTLSRKQTEQIAKKLMDYGIRAQHYHAAMSSEEKTTVQRDWQRGAVKVVVATIAFGMGIDKPDVRFVIHHYLPKSLEGYYQETGRAGRDGLPSDCYLFFSHGDIHQLRKFIDDSDGSRAQKERQKEMLNRVVMFCENTRDCRRSQLLRYFSETFSGDKCGMNCDNCKNGGVHEFEDRTKYAQAILQAVMYYTRLTMIQCTDYLSGKKKPENDPQPFHGIAKSLTKYEINQIIMKLAFENALGEENRVGGGGIAIQYFILGKEAASFLTGGRTCPMLVRHGSNKKAPAKTTKKKATKKASADETRPVSTCISSPVRGGARQSKKGKSVARFFDDEAVGEGEEDEELDPRDLHVNGYEQDGFVVEDDEDEDDYFDPPVAPPRRQRRQRTLDELAPQHSIGTTEGAVDEIHEMMIAEFLERAKKLEEETRNNRGLRRTIFTEAQMKQMAVQWTDSVDKMRRIPGIDLDKVGKYGSRFIPLVKEWQAKYLELMATDDAMATIPATAGPSTSRRGLPLQSGDVIDLLSDDDEEDGDYEDQGVSSRYFAAGGHAPDDPLERQLAQSEQRFAATSQIEELASRGRSYSKNGSKGGKRSYYRKGGSGSRGGSRSYSGVSKRKGASSNAGGGNRRGSAGSARSGASRSAASAAKKSGGSGIGLMPF